MKLVVYGQPLVNSVSLLLASGPTHRYNSPMRYVFILLAIFGIVVSSLALREHYRKGNSPCSINDKWDCGIVNKSPYATLQEYVPNVILRITPAIGKIPVAVIGIAGFLLIGLLSVVRRYGLLLIAAVLGLAFSLHLANIEAKILGVWCIYCVMSLGAISLITLLAIATVIVMRTRRRASA